MLHQDANGYRDRNHGAFFAASNTPQPFKKYVPFSWVYSNPPKKHRGIWHRGKNLPPCQVFFQDRFKGVSTNTLYAGVPQK